MSASQPAYFSLQQFSDLGALLVGGRLYTYAQGTTTFKTAYTDPAGAVPQTYTTDGLGGQYIALNARGELPAPLYLAAGSYDIALKRADGSTVWTRRAEPTGDFTAPLFTSSGSNFIPFIQSGSGAVPRSVQSELRDTVKVEQFGAVGDGTTYNDAAILAAIAALKSDGVMINGTMTYNVGTIEFGKGAFLVHHSTLDLIGCLNVTFQGKGSRNFFSYWKGPSRLIIDGAGSTSASYGIKLTADNSRNFTLRDMELAYQNGFAGDLIKTSAAGLTIENAFLGSTSTSSNRVYTCQNLISANNGHHYRIRNSTLTDAVRGIYGDNTTAPNVNGWEISGCTFYDFTRAAIETNTPSAFSMDIAGCDFDPVDPGNIPLYAIKTTMYGVSIHGCEFAGSNLVNEASIAWVSVDEGVCSISGNTFWGQDQLAVQCTAGRTLLEANAFFCSRAVKTTGAAALYGKGNRYSHTGALTTDVAVELAPSSATTIDIGPDYFSTGFQNSYKIGGGSTITGRIGYNPNEDNSTSAFTYTNARGSIRIDSTHTHLDDSTAAGALTAKMTGRTLNNVGTWTLPASTETAGQLEFSFFKSAAGAVTINAGAGCTLYDGAGKASIANSTAEIGATIRFKAIDGTKWEVVSSKGTWA